MSEEQATPGNRAEIVRAGVSRELAREEKELATNAAIAKARAEVEAPYTLARHFPRSWLDVRTKLLNELDRVEYAKASLYERKQGRKQNEQTGRWEDNIIKGLSIRFAESAMALSGNMRAGQEIQYDDDDKRIYRVFVIDLETNAINEATIVVEKTVERNDESSGNRTVRYTRQSVDKKNVHICDATEDEITLKANNTGNRAKRNLILALVPPDIKDECLAKAIAVKAANIAKDPHGERKKIADSFAELNVFPSALEEYMGHPLDQCSPAEIGLLQGLFAAIRAGEATWPEIVGERSKPEAEQVKTNRGKKLAEELKAKSKSPEAAAKTDGKPTPAKK